MAQKGIGVDKKILKRRTFIINEISVENPYRMEKACIYTPSKGVTLEIVWSELPDITEEELEDKTDEIISSEPREITLKFITPYWIVKNKKLLRKPEMEAVIANLARKYSVIKNYYLGEEPLTKDEASKIIKLARENIKIEEDETSDVTIRHLSIERERIEVYTQFSIGTIKYQVKPEIYKHKESKKLFTLLKLGEHINTGKLASAGFGHYQILINNK